jgi:ferredoxin
MKLEIDPAACTGHGRCYSVVPELFDATDDGYGIVRAETVTEAQRADAERAVDSCPEQAISLKP